jgi:peptide-methionine (S)-S-oxide reductase
LPHHERIADPDFRRAVALIDAGDAEGLAAHLAAHPGLAARRVAFEGEDYFTNPTLLCFVAENPVRNGTLPPNVAEVARVILDAGRAAVGETLALVASGRVARECGVQRALIALLCRYGADPDGAMVPALTHGEWDAVEALLEAGAGWTVPVAASLGDAERVPALLADAGAGDRHLAFALAAQHGRAAIVEMLLDAGEDPNRYNPKGAHSHSTPLHQAVWGGHLDVVRLLVERGARRDLKDTLWQGTPLDWAEYGGQHAIADYLRGLDN